MAALTTRVGPRLVLAMAQFQAGSAREARRTLVSAVQAYEWTETQLDQPTIWVSHVLRREAEILILPNLRAFHAGTYQPHDTDERLAFLGVCDFSNHSLALVRLYNDAFAADSGLVEEPSAGHRYNAARAAAMAGCGRSRDAARLEETGRMKWRTQAKEWLRADLAAWGKALDQDPSATRDGVRQRLTQWRADPNRVGLREPVELAKLGADERRDCLTLWDEVTDAIKRSTDTR